MTTFDRIKNLAKKRGLSLQKVAEKSEIGTNTIYKWKNYDSVVMLSLVILLIYKHLFLTCASFVHQLLLSRVNSLEH